MKKRILSAILAMLIVLTMIPVTTPAVLAADAVSYIDRVWDGTKVVSTEKTVTDYTVVTSEIKTMNSGWYVVTDNVTVDNNVTVSGTAHIILCDGKTLTITHSLRVSEGNSVFIYGQKNDSGKLSANASGKGAGAGIGGYTDHKNAGQITINGGIVDAKGDIMGAGIGGAAYGGAGQITINGGSVNATGASEAAGIGTGFSGNGAQDGQTITINGGSVSTLGPNGAPGIGFAAGGQDSYDTSKLYMTITINGGVVKADTYYVSSENAYSVAIGAAKGARGNAVLNINGGTIYASAQMTDSGQYSASGIGSSSSASDWTVVITGGTIRSTGLFDFGTVDKYRQHFQLILKNASGQDLTLRTVTVDDAANKTQLVAATGFSYGVRDVYTDQNKLYFYLPADTDLAGTTLKTAAGCVYEWNGTEYTHTYTPADCLTPAKCYGCSKTVGDPLGHNFVNGFCSRSGCDVNEPPVSSNGTYKISNAGQLYWFCEHVNAGNVTANAVLTADITVNEGDLSAMTGPNASLKAWIPIGKISKNETKQYNGTFDGAGHTINGLYFYTEAFEASYGGLIGKLGRNGVVKNVTVAKSWFGATSYTGAIVGSLEGGTIDNCHNESFVGAAARIGGIVGHIASGTVSNCTNRGKVGFYKAHPDLPLTFECIGGIAGNNSGTITMCTNYAEIKGVGATSVAGISGQTFDGKTEYSLNMATVNGETNTGGISGWTYNSTLTGCVNIGTVNGTAASGGLTGGTNGAKFSNCYYVGEKATGYAETASGATRITEADLYSGEIGYGLGWGQTLDGKSLPYPGGPAIYRYYTSSYSFAYTNNAGFSCNHKDGTATCMAAAICSGCKQGYGEKNSQNHVGGDDTYYINPENTAQHCKGCPCGEASLVEKHSFNRPEGICKKCNAVCGVDTEHNWSKNGGYCPECSELVPAEMDTDGFYKISTFGNLIWFARQVNSGHTTICGKLTKNIETTYHVYDNYEPIGRTYSFGSDAEGGFEGIFDGQGYYIYGFDYMIPVDSDGTYGVFGTVADGGVVRNLGVYSGYMSLGDGTYDIRAGFIAGQVSEGGLIENCYVDGATIKAPQRVAGGIAGLNQGIVRNCFAYEVNISAHTNRFGGIVGDYQGGMVDNCYTTFATIGSTANGGVTGTAVNSEDGISIERFATGEIAYKLNKGVTDGTQPYSQLLTGRYSDDCPRHYRSSSTVYGFVNDKIELYSNTLSFDLSQSFTFAKGEEANIPTGATINLAEGVTLDIYATISADATFTGSGHAYVGKWTYENNGTPTHIRICSVDGCEEKQYSYTDHVGGEGTSTCISPALCDLCDTPYGSAIGGNHDASVSFDENGFCENGCYEAAEEKDGVYRITNAGNLFWFAEQVNAGNATASAILTDDIDLEGREWTTIISTGLYYDTTNYTNKGYEGTFDGSGHVISNFKIIGTDGVKATYGLFGTLSGTVRNLGVDNMTFTLPDGYNGNSTDVRAAGIAGQMIDGSRVENCYVINSALTPNNYIVGGVAGCNYAGTIENCYTYNVTVSGHSRCGNLVSDTRGDINTSDRHGAVINCYTDAARLAGTQSGSLISGCAEGTAAKQFASGEIAYKLGDAFGQTCGKGLPVVGGAKVYKIVHCNGSDYYSNVNADLEHDFDENGFCSNGCYESAELNENGYYEIERATQLFWFAELVNSGDYSANAILLNNITIPEGKAWTPIGSTAAKYSGIFDGAGKTVDFGAQTVTESYYALFGCINGALLKNVKVSGTVTVDAPVEFVGGIVGHSDSGTIEGCTSFVDITLTENAAGAKKIGGIAGSFMNGSGATTVSKCANYGDIMANGAAECVGGISGYANRYDMIVDCANYGDITANGVNYVSGILAYVNYSSFGGVQNCLNVGAVTGDTEYVGDIVGALRDYESDTIKNNYYTGANGFGKNEKPEKNASATQVSAEQLESGEIALLLCEAWGQTIGTDAYPVLGGDTVYQVLNCIGEAAFSNTNENIGHKYGGGVCTVCGTPDPDYVEEGSGDINGDGSINAIDANLMKRILAGASTPSEDELAKADINSDGSINGIDSNILARIIAGTN